ncbi:hypothetical protein, partial [Pandoraea apista]|uniref:hypothetical protein n=1 Tax=Pandoraea apista TaxID=93218 RepID=UPI001C8ADB70
GEFGAAPTCCGAMKYNSAYIPLPTLSKPEERSGHAHQLPHPSVLLLDGWTRFVIDVSARQSSISLTADRLLPARAHLSRQPPASLAHIRF